MTKVVVKTVSGHRSAGRLVAPLTFSRNVNSPLPRDPRASFAIGTAPAADLKYATCSLLRRSAVRIRGRPATVSPSRPLH